MVRVLEAVYEDGVFKPFEDPGLRDHERVVLEIKDRVGEQRERPKQRMFGGAKDLIKVSGDFDEPLEDFREYME